MIDIAYPLSARLHLRSGEQETTPDVSHTQAGVHVDRVSCRLPMPRLHGAYDERLHDIPKTGARHVAVQERDGTRNLG